ncbi:MAG: NUDIX hydrolase [Actinobacteria bacterium]|nr:NUDIX hydrolase [Actinomycetota bacterium]NDG27334.1 NUDIX hydrolase [Pseudomonadota bacterium]
MADKLIEYLTIYNKIRDSSRIFCHKIEDSHKVYGVIAITTNQKILLVRGKRTGKWSLPKGHIENEETPEECAKREMSEETGIIIKEFSRKNDIAKLKVGIYYFFETDTEIVLNPNDMSEITESGWFSLAELVTKDMEFNVDANYIFRCLKKCWL